MTSRATLRAGLFAALLLAVLPSQAQKAVLLDDRPAIKFKFTSGGAVLVRYQKEESGGVFRFPVVHDHFGYCQGFLHISKTRIAYDAAATPEYSQDAFNTPRNQLSISAAPGEWISVETPDRIYNFSLTWDQDPSISDVGSDTAYNDAIRFLALAISDFDAAEKEFNQLTEPLRKKDEPPAAPPVISIFEPAGAEDGKTVQASGGNLRLHGIATQPSGIANVMVNGKGAFLKTLSPQVVEFDVRDFSLEPGINPVVISAIAADKSETHITLKVSRPEVRVLEPAVGGETSDAEVRVRGVASGFSEVENVEVGGVRATLRRRGDGSVEFEAEKVPLALGPNTLQGFVASAGGQREPFKVEVKRLPPPGPPALSEKEVTDALTSGMTPARVTALVKQYGVDFELTDEAEKRLRAAGADDTLLLAIAKSKK